MKMPDVSRLGVVDIEDAGRYRILMVREDLEADLGLRHAIAILADRWEAMGRLPGVNAPLWALASEELRVALLTFPI